MTEVMKLNQVVPETFANELRGLYRRDLGSKYQPVTPLLCTVIAQARELGWTLKAIGDAIGISRERVRQLAAAAPTGLRVACDIPAPPTKPEPFKWVPPTLTAEQAEQLRELNERAKARGLMPDDHPAVVASREVAALIQSYLDAGHRLIDLARTLGVGKTAIHFRLGRWGYRNLAPSQRSARHDYLAEKASEL